MNCNLNIYAARDDAICTATCWMCTLQLVTVRLNDARGNMSLDAACVQRNAAAPPQWMNAVLRWQSDNDNGKYSKIAH